MARELSVEQVLSGYCCGAFPMGQGGRIDWYSPDPRAIIELDHFHVSHTLAKTIRRGVFEIAINRDFVAVMKACGEREEGTWITARIGRVYEKLHELGFAHTVETYRDGQLVGGLYGVAIGGAFFGESMFHRVTDASKVALAALVERLRQRGFTLLDTQWLTPHLARMGASEIPRDEYLERLEQAIRLPRTFIDGLAVNPWISEAALHEAEHE